MGYYSSLGRGSNLTCSEFQFQLKTRKKLLSAIFDQHRDIHMVTCCEFLWVCEYNKQQGCILDCEVQEVVLSFAFDQFAVMGIGLHPDI